MSLLKYINRLKRMDDLIRRRATGKADDFAHKMDISRSQLLQDLKELREMGAPIEFDSFRQTYFYAKDYILTPGFLVDGQYVRGGWRISSMQDFSINRLPFILFFVLVAIYAHAQISGTVTDKKTKRAVPDVEVFIQGKTPFAMTNVEGQFALTTIRPGFADVVLYKKGYRLFKSSIRIQDGKAYVLNLTIDPAPKEKVSKGSKGDHLMELKMVKEALLGKGFEAGYKVLNEEVLSFIKVDEGILLKSSGPLLIDNVITGYHVYYYLQEGLLNADKIMLAGYSNFQPMQAQGSDQIVQWTENRLKAYQGSLRHLFKSLVQGKAEQEGFEFFDKKGTRLNPSGMFSPSIPNHYKILLTDTVKVTYKTKTGEILSTQLIPRGSLQVNDEGVLLIPENLEVIGSMRNAGLITLLPQDYELVLPNTEDFMRFYEKIYVHTDKPYYYPGEPLWFKGYINYYAPAWRDSLSKVVYVEIINPKKMIILSKILRIDSGLFYNDFILPDTLRAGTYYLRAYTNLNRNFGDANLFIKPVPILNPTDKADHTQAKQEINSARNLLSITADKQKYKTREKITLTFMVKDTVGNPMKSNLSLSVTDALQVVPLEEACTIIQGYPMEAGKSIKNMEFKYPVEFGISFSGRFTNDKGKPEKTTLSILQTGTRNMTLAETNDEGLFWQAGLQFFDTASFSLKSDKAKDTPYGKIDLLKREKPSLDFKKNTHKIDILNTESPQRIISEYEVLKDTRLLEAVEIKANRIHLDEANDNPDYYIKHPYGRPDYVLKAKDLNTSYGNLLYTLPGKVPGLVVRQAPDGKGFRWVVYTLRGATSSLMNPQEVLVMVNNVILGGTPEDILSSINPNNVESIEVTTRINSLYGSQGGFGVVSIHTKMGEPEESLKRVQNFQKIKIMGFSLARKFRSPVYDESNTERTTADYRSTIYWNPIMITNVKSGIATVSFFAADLPGHYRIVAEGVTQNGEPVRCVHITEIDNN